MDLERKKLAYLAYLTTFESNIVFNQVNLKDLCKQLKNIYFVRDLPKTSVHVKHK